MSVLDAFLSTWSNARATFGEGVPQPGTGYDQSASLTTLKSDLDQAAHAKAEADSLIASCRAAHVDQPERILRNFVARYRR